MIWLWLACSGGDPELAAQRAALDQWQQGREALARGEAAAAAAAFERARQARPDDAVLVAWQAQALAEGGDPAAAAALLDGLLHRVPRFVEARYNRAAYLARAGALDLAGPELQRALADGARRAREAMVDPDFAPHLDHPAFAFLPAEMLMIAVDAPREAVFWGGEATVRLRVVGGLGEAVAVEVGEVSGPIALVGALEDVVDSTEGPVRDLSWTFVVRGAGEAVIGPFRVRSGAWSRQVDAVRFPTTAPPGRAAPAAPPPTLDIPSALAVGLSPPQVRWRDGWLDVLTLPADRVELSPPAAPLRYELRDRSRPVWVLHRVQAEQRPSVVVRRLGDEVLRSP